MPSSTPEETFAAMRRRNFTGSDGETLTITGTGQHISIVREGTSTSLVIRTEDADRIAALILEARPNPHE